MALHCPATLLIARHGEADNGHGQAMSDDGGWLTTTGRAQVATLAGALRAERVSEVHSSLLARAVESAEVAADVLALRARPIVGLEEIRVGSCAGLPYSDSSFQDVFARWIAGDLQARVPGGESGAEVLARFHEGLMTIADEHRGETVLVFSHGAVMRFALPRLADNTPDNLAAGAHLPHAVPARVEMGEDGIRILDWPRLAEALG